MPPRERVIRVEATLEQLQELQALKARREAQIARRLSKVDVFGLLGFTPNCKVQHAARLAGEPIPPRCGQCPQERFVDLPDDDLDVLYGGAGGGGKSFSGLMIALRACVKFPGIQVFWFRRSFPELNQSVLRTLARFGHARQLGATWNGSTYELRFPGGSVLTFAHAKNMQEASALSSAEINLLILDERTTIDPEVVNFLYTRVRSGVPGVPCLGVRSMSNPGFVGHGVVKKGYVDATDYGKLELIDKAGRRRIFIPAKISDNPFVGSYEKVLEGIDDPELRRRIMDGDWSVMPDQAFPDWRRDAYTDTATGQRVGGLAVPAFDVPASWIRYGGLDYGWTAPSVYLLAARNSDGRVWFYAELSMRQTPEREQARKVRALEGDHVVATRAADPAMWGKAGSALPPASQFALEGTPLRKADNDRFGGKQRVHQYLAPAPACAYHRDLGFELCPNVHVVETGCPELLTTMENLPRDPRKPEDVDTNAADHHYDSARYALMAIGTAPSVIFDDDDDRGELVDHGGLGFRPEDLSIPGYIPEPGVTPGVAAASPWVDHAAQPARVESPWSQV